MPRKPKPQSDPKWRGREPGPKDIALGQRIRLRRVELKMSQTGLAQEIGVTFQQVQKYEKGVNRVGATRLEKIAEALKVPSGFFFSDAGKQHAEVESLLFLDSTFSLRLLRAYSAIKSVKVRRQFVSLMEHVAGLESDDE